MKDRARMIMGRLRVPGRRLAGGLAWLLRRGGLLWQICARLLRLAPAVLLLGLAARLLLRPDALPAQREAERLLRQGRVQESLWAYQALYLAGDRRPELLLALGRQQQLRGEAARAKLWLLEALAGGLSPDGQSAARLEYGWMEALQGRLDRAHQLWESLPPAWQPRAQILRAEVALRQGDLRAARDQFERALRGTLPETWQGLAHYRLAMLRGARERQAALAELSLARAQPAPTSTSFLPLSGWSPHGWSTRLQALDQALQASQQERTLLLATLAGEEDLPTTAHALLLDGSEAGELDERALIFDAGLRQRMGDHAGALALLEQALARFPDSASLTRLLALLESGRDGARAQSLLDLAGALEPGSVDNLVVQATLYRQAHDYQAAADLYDQIVRLAREVDRPIYHYQASRFFFETTWLQCQKGLGHAEAAAAGLPSSLDAWVLLSEMLLRCAEHRRALEVATELYTRWPDEPAGYYARGAALLALGQADEARRPLIQAIDLAPHGPWRARAEALLGERGPATPLRSR